MFGSKLEKFRPLSDSGNVMLSPTPKVNDAKKQPAFLLNYKRIQLDQMHVYRLVLRKEQRRTEPHITCSEGGDAKLVQTKVRELGPPADPLFVHDDGQREDSDAVKNRYFAKQFPLMMEAAEAALSLEDKERDKIYIEWKAALGGDPYKLIEKAIAKVQQDQNAGEQARDAIALVVRLKAEAERHKNFKQILMQLGDDYKAGKSDEKKRKILDCLKEWKEVVGTFSGTDQMDIQKAIPYELIVEFGENGKQQPRPDVQPATPPQVRSAEPKKEDKAFFDKAQKGAVQANAAPAKRAAKHQNQDFDFLTGVMPSVSFRPSGLA